MSRLYLIAFLFISMNAQGQNLLKKYLKFAEEKYEQGDYYYALDFYEKAMELDSNTIEILWKVAETHRAYKDYRKAEYYYAKVYEREEAKLYPSSLLQLGLMQKQNGKYDKAIATFKKAKKKYYKKKKSYLYRKSKQELASSIWAKSNVIDTSKVIFEQLPESVNTKNSEFGHTLEDGQLIFSSLRADSISANEEVYEKNYRTQIYGSQQENEVFQTSTKINDLALDGLNIGNGTFSLDKKRFYFSVCGEDGYNYTCKIAVARYSNGKWNSIDTLGEIINERGANTTMPCIAEIKGKEALVFSSDREGGEGGLDLYYSFIKNGNQFGKVRAIRTLNTLDNEVTPSWDNSTKTLYFSSSWESGFGGLDVFSSQFTDRFEKPINLGQPVNSPANDLYYFKSGDTSFVTSNRLGVLYSKNPTCCSDIFMISPIPEPEPPTKEETLAELMKRLPVTLYFHNDVPNPRSRATKTKLTYMETYDEYHTMLEKYQQEYSKGLTEEKAMDAREDIEDFFIEYVDKGVADLNKFQRLLLAELDKGLKIVVRVQGFASPLAKTDYNVNLTKRRISSLKNYLRKTDGGAFAKYMDSTASNGGRLIITEVPFGEYTANQLTSDNPNDVQNSVYSRAAAIERKIEIQSVSFLEGETREFPLMCKNAVIDLGDVNRGTFIEKTFVLENKSNEEVEFKIDNGFTLASFSVDKNTIGPKEKLTVTVRIDTKKVDEFMTVFGMVKIPNLAGDLQLVVTGQVK